MPDDRLFHKRLGHSKKVNSLTDLEFRVWVQYELSADDFGVMRYSAVTIQADNDALEARPAKVIQRALDRLVETGLVLSFEHQSQRYLCQADWQNFQRVRFPRATVHPVPPADVLAKCSASTRERFQQRTSGPSEESQDDSGDSSEVSPHPARAGGREWLTANGNGKRQTANGSGVATKSVDPDEAEKDALAARAGRFVERYGDLHRRFRNGAAYVGRVHVDYQEALQLVKVYDDDRLDILATAFLNSDDDFSSTGTRTIAKFRSRASWCDDRLRGKGL